MNVDTYAMASTNKVQPRGELTAYTLQAARPPSPSPGGDKVTAYLCLRLKSRKWKSVVGK